MALPSRIYRASIELADLDRNLYEKLETTVARHPSETSERLIARLLAYALCYRDDLSFTKGIAAADEPDLWSKEPDGRVREWIEVGLPDFERLRKVSRHSEVVILLASGTSRGLQSWQEQVLPKLVVIDNLTVISLDPAFVAEIVARLQRAIVWSLTITEGNLYLSIGNDTLESSLLFLQGER
jgi:uncharacterized protein YaeQ